METTCGGSGNIPQEEIQEIGREALKRTHADLEYHPCGCEVCTANLLLGHLRNVRSEHGHDPHTGKKS